MYVALLKGKISLRFKQSKNQQIKLFKFTRLHLLHIYDELSHLGHKYQSTLLFFVHLLLVG